MTIQEFKDSLIIDKNFIDNNFVFEQEISFDLSKTNNCPLCNSHYMNIWGYRTESWTKGMGCNECKRIMFCYITDRMGGCTTDTIFIYKEKKS